MKNFPDRLVKIASKISKPTNPNVPREKTNAERILEEQRKQQQQRQQQQE